MSINWNEKFSITEINRDGKTLFSFLNKNKSKIITLSSICCLGTYFINSFPATTISNLDLINKSTLKKPVFITWNFYNTFSVPPHVIKYVGYSGAAIIAGTIVSLLLKNEEFKKKHGKTIAVLFFSAGIIIIVSIALS